MDENVSEYVSVEQYNKLIAQKIAVEIRCKELENIIKRITIESIPA